MLSNTSIKAAQLKHTPYKLTDERGLYLIVTPGGSKWRRFKFRFDGQEKLLSLAAGYRGDAKAVGRAGCSGWLIAHRGRRNGPSIATQRNSLCCQTEISSSMKGWEEGDKEGEYGQSEANRPGTIVVWLAALYSIS